MNTTSTGQSVKQYHNHYTAIICAPPCRQKKLTATDHHFSCFIDANRHPNRSFITRPDRLIWIVNGTRDSLYRFFKPTTTNHLTWNISSRLIRPKPLGFVVRHFPIHSSLSIISIRCARFGWQSITDPPPDQPIVLSARGISTNLSLGRSFISRALVLLRGTTTDRPRSA